MTCGGHKTSNFWDPQRRRWVKLFGGRANFQKKWVFPAAPKALQKIALFIQFFLRYLGQNPILSLGAKPDFAPLAMHWGAFPTCPQTLAAGVPPNSSLIIYDNVFHSEQGWSRLFGSLAQNWNERHLRWISESHKSMNSNHLNDTRPYSLNSYSKTSLDQV